MQRDTQVEIVWLRPCHFRTLLFSEGCMGDIGSGDSKETFKTSKEQTAFANVEVTAQPRLRHAAVAWLGIRSRSLLTPRQAKCPHTLAAVWLGLPLIICNTQLAVRH